MVKKFFLRTAEGKSRIQKVIGDFLEARFYKHRSAAFLKELIVASLRHDIMAKSASLAYFLIFAIFPSLIFITSAVGFLSINWEAALESLYLFLPTEIYEFLTAYLKTLAPSKNILFLLGSLIVAIFSVTRGVDVLSRSLDLSFGAARKNAGLKGYLLSAFCSLTLFAIIIFNLMLAPLSAKLIYFISKDIALSPFLMGAWELLRGLLMLSSFFLCFALLYYLLPFLRVSFLSVLPGALFAGGGFLISSYVFKFLAANLFGYSALYGSLATALIFLLWFYILSFLILIGGEISASFFRKWK